MFALFWWWHRRPGKSPTKQKQLDNNATYWHQISSILQCRFILPISYSPQNRDRVDTAMGQVNTIAGAGLLAAINPTL
jgi:hypothetical protein